MKIGIVCPYNIFGGGGVQEHVLALKDGLAKKGHTVKVITPLPKGHRADEDADFIFVGTARNVKIFHTANQVSASTGLSVVEDMLEREKFDVLHFHEPGIPLLSRQLLARSNAVNIGTFHAKLPETVMASTFERVIAPYTKSIIKYLDALTAVSPAAAGYVESLTDQHIEIVPNGIDFAKYQIKRTAGVKQKTILYVGRLEKRKGVRWLLEAFALLQKEEPQVRLILAGDGVQRAVLEELASDLDLKNVQFLGYVDESTKLKLFSEATVFCAPALYGESFGIVLLEAMAMGIPTIAGDNPGYSAVLAGRGRLSLVNPKDTNDFARRLSLLLNDDELRAAWQKWAATEITQYDYSKIIDQYEAVYKTALSTKMSVHTPEPLPE